SARPTTRTASARSGRRSPWRWRRERDARGGVAGGAAPEPARARRAGRALRGRDAPRARPRRARPLLPAGRAAAAGAGDGGAGAGAGAGAPARPQEPGCAASRGIGFPAQPGGIRRNSLGQPTYLEAKAKGDNSMSVKRLQPESVVGLVPQGPRDTVKA
ncbi:MAG: hypothetical protein F4236_07190, partial [Acidimicrobiia bacterium]|nr:hypothetical protein [Acidimicrobiia bacterium]